ncbi:unnamed protein product [Knipowitschia caucasica]|uniref:CAP-Gly domain-containing protein n=1 Tax=Knipowitschia caucasica TaxID=637954 RepID=A0AAV2MAN0_KNICA
MADVLWPVCAWTFKGILCTCRFLWICPYNAVHFLPRERQKNKYTERQPKGSCDCAAPGPTSPSPDRITDLHTRVTKTEKEILALKTRTACERASWERRFTELQRKQEQTLSQLRASQGVEQRAGSEAGVDNGEVFEESTSEESDVWQSLSRCEVASRAEHTDWSRPSSSSSVFSGRSWRSGQRVFVPHSPLDLTLGHRVRVVLPSGRISTGSVRFIGHLQGEEELHLGVELPSPDPALTDGSHRGQCYFQCKPGCGAFVPFHKLLMAWE